MVQSGSAQREPSMEEILASIRRIIEDSDSGRPPEDDAPPAAVAAPVTVQEAQPQAAEGEVEAFRAELEEPARVQPAPSMADIQAAISSEAHGRDDPAQHLRHEAESSPFHPERSFDEPEAAFPAASRQAEIASQDEYEQQDDIAEEPIVEDVAQPAFISQHPVEISRARPSIISEHAGRQVTAAFEELSEAFAATRQRSFDEMAEEMLRPMLQDWLDNNLPTLVERLVREEIERVARGAQG